MQIESFFFFLKRKGKVKSTEHKAEFPSAVARGTFGDSGSGEADGLGCLDKGRLNCTALAAGGEKCLLFTFLAQILPLCTGIWTTYM